VSRFYGNLTEKAYEPFGTPMVFFVFVGLQVIYFSSTKGKTWSLPSDKSFRDKPKGHHQKGKEEHQLVTLSNRRIGKNREFSSKLGVIIHTWKQPRQFLIHSSHQFLVFGKFWETSGEFVIGITVST
jgi:hypothetical protein